MEEDIRVRQATKGDVKDLSCVLARAFQNEPIHRWIVRDDTSWKRNSPRIFRVFLDNMIRDGTVLTTEQLQGASLWSVPERPHGGLLSMILLPLLLTMILGKRAALLGREMEKLEKRRPREPHWYLMFLGTDPVWRGRGVGSALLSPILNRCDETRLQAYLLTATKENITYYEHHGFRVVDHTDIQEGPSAWSMIRHPNR
jgi:N-acetylglutamate synthase-like GNAT family acetyltransferase